MSHFIKRQNASIHSSPVFRYVFHFAFFSTYFSSPQISIFFFKFSYVFTHLAQRQLPWWYKLSTLSQQYGYFTGGKRFQTWAANPGSTPGRLSRTRGVGRVSHNLLFGWQAAQIWGRFWAGLPKVLPGVLPRVSSELPSPGGGKELAVADSIIYTV